MYFSKKKIEKNVLVFPHLLDIFPLQQGFKKVNIVTSVFLRSVYYSLNQTQLLCRETTAGCTNVFGF